MTGYLLDTNVVSASMVAQHPFHMLVENRLRQLQGPIFISVVVLGEIYFGLNNKNFPVPCSVEKDIRKNLIAVEILPITRHIAHAYGQIRQDLFQKYASRDLRGHAKQKLPELLVDAVTGASLGIQENDLWFVATALSHGLTVLTLDKAGGMKRIVAIAEAHGLRADILE